MTRLIHLGQSKSILLSILAIAVLPAQTPSPRPAFEVASIKPSSADGSSSGITTGRGRLVADNVTLKRCIMGAYRVGPNQIFGGPDWMDVDRFNISAKAEQPTNDDAVISLMTQSLLADRFKLVLHRETRSVPAYVLEVARNGPKLEKAPAGEASTHTSGSNMRVSIDARHTSMDGLATALGRQLDLPVVNQTKLEGLFHFKLQWIPDSFRTSDGSIPEGASLFAAIQEQLGLHIRAQKAPVEVLVIDRAEKPSDN